MKQPQYNTALYMRLSRDDESFGDSVSIETQRTVLTQFVMEHPEFYVVSEFVDDGWSGTNFDRPQFKRMIEEIEAGNINCVITKDDCVILELNAESPIKCWFCAVSSIF